MSSYSPRDLSSRISELERELAENNETLNELESIFHNQAKMIDEYEKQISHLTRYVEKLTSEEYGLKVLAERDRAEMALDTLREVLSLYIALQNIDNRSDKYALLYNDLEFLWERLTDTDRTLLIGLGISLFESNSQES